MSFEEKEDDDETYSSPQLRPKSPEFVMDIKHAITK